MAVSKLHILLISFLLTLTFTQITSNDVSDKLTPLGSDEFDSFRIELDKLTSKIESLESLVHKKTEELSIKDDVISGKDKVVNEKEKLIKEKSDSISLLKSEVASLKVKGSSDAKEQVQKANTRSQELEKQVHSAWLPPWLAAQLACSQSYVEARWIEHGKPVLETFAQKALEKRAQTEKWAEPHIDTIKIVAKKFCKPYIAQVADATKQHLDKARETMKPYTYGKFLESATKYHDQWIPAAKEQWVTVITTVEPHVQLATKRTKKIYVQSKEVVAPHVIKIKETVEPHFQVAKTFCRPYIAQVADATKQHLDKARETMKPYTYGKFLESATKYHDQWIPAAKEQWVTVITTVEPHVQLATKRTKKFYVQSKEVVAPHVIKIKETVDPHFQVAKKFCKPFIDQVADATKPHLDKARETMKSYTNEAFQAYGKFLESATKYLDQWIPAAKEQWVTVITTVEPHVQLATKRTKKIYVQSKEVVAPHVIKIKETVDPHFQVADATKPHLDKARETMKSYTNEAFQAYGKFLESATKYLDQVKGTVEESLKKHEITRPLATNKDFIWLAASALLALPIIILFKTLSILFFGTAKKPTRNSKPTHNVARLNEDIQTSSETESRYAHFT